MHSNHQLSFTLIMESISLAHYDHYNLDLMVPNYVHGFDDFMFPLSGFLDEALSTTMVDEVFDDKLDCIFNLEQDLSSNCGNVQPDGDAAGDHGGSSNGDSYTMLTKPRKDRSKTLVLERKRRGRMKDMLYELRSLVPNITKMDKSSIIGDAVAHVRGLQKEEKKLLEEIAVLESFPRDQPFKMLHQNLYSQVEERRDQPNGGRVHGVTAHELGEGRFYVELESSTGDRIAGSIYDAIESLEGFELERSNICMDSERYSLTLTLNVNGFGEEVISASTVELWMMGALLKQGLKFDMTTVP